VVPGCTGVAGGVDGGRGGGCAWSGEAAYLSSDPGEREADICEAGTGDAGTGDADPWAAEEGMLPPLVG